MKKTTRIYLAEQTYPNKGKFEIYENGKPTGQIVDRKRIRKLLNKSQFKDFSLGDDIFIIQKENIQNNPTKLKLYGKTHDNFNF